MRSRPALLLEVLQTTASCENKTGHRLHRPLGPASVAPPPRAGSTLHVTRPCCGDRATLPRSRAQWRPDLARQDRVRFPDPASAGFALPAYVALPAEHRRGTRRDWRSELLVQTEMGLSNLWKPASFHPVRSIPRAIQVRDSPSLRSGNHGVSVAPKDGLGFHAHREDFLHRPVDREISTTPNLRRSSGAAWAACACRYDCVGVRVHNTPPSAIEW